MLKSHTHWITKVRKKMSEDVCITLRLGSIHRICFVHHGNFHRFLQRPLVLSVDGRLMGAFHARTSRKEPAVPIE
jgi:hypothetical protein